VVTREQQNAPLQPSIEAELDDDDEIFENEELINDGVMQEYLREVQKRLQLEMNGVGEAKTLMSLLDQDDWWLRASYSKEICQYLDIVYSEPTYYRDVYVWVPDVRWDSRDFMPCCPTCLSKCRVGFHCWRDNHIGRRICDMTTHYYTISRRYKCHTCHDRVKAFQAVAEGVGYMVNEEVDEVEVELQQYTFMGWDQRSLPHLPFGYGSKFPAFLTHRGGIDLGAIDLMRSLFDKGVRPESFSKTILELHAKKYTKDYIEREYDYVRRRSQVFFDGGDPGLYSTFSDKRLYGGLVPTGKWLATVYKLFQATLEEHFNREVKKRGCERLHWDASYKEPKHLCQHHGEGIFSALITGTNDRGEIRMQFHVVTDGHDQFIGPLEELKDTLRSYGQAEPEHFSTDNPAHAECMVYV
jgi:hypothetical protein